MRPKAILLISLIFLFTGCSPYYTSSRDTNSDTYDMQECYQKIRNKKPIPWYKKIDKIVLIKHQRKMYLYKRGKVVNIFPVSLGKESDDGHKIMKGDGKTPEGFYTINSMRCHEKRYFSMYISYPNAQDRALAKRLGVNPGGHVAIHGNPKWNSDGHGDAYSLARDWTRGCIGVPNKTMDYLFEHVDYNTPIEIRP